MLHLDHDEHFWNGLKHQPNPELRAQLIRKVAASGFKPDSLLDRLQREPDPAILQAIVLALGDFPHFTDDPSRRDQIVAALLAIYRENVDPGVHSAGEWLLKRWNAEIQRRPIDEELHSREPIGARQWYLNAKGHTLVVVPGPVEFLMGSPVQEPGRELHETLMRRRVSRTFAISSTETTVEQLLRFREEFKSRWIPNIDPSLPAGNISWYESVAYCRWLSDQEQVPDDQMCYPPLSDIGPAMKLPVDLLERTGYRLPTEAEWEYGCRAGTTTPYCCGNDPKLLVDYACFETNSEKRLWPVGSRKPNELGLFDCHGSVVEWCSDYTMLVESRPAGKPTEDALWLETDGNRSARGGAFYSSTGFNRSASRGWFEARYSHPGLGFRVARTMRK